MACARTVVNERAYQGIRYGHSDRTGSLTVAELCRSGRELTGVLVQSLGSGAPRCRRAK